MRWTTGGGGGGIFCFWDFGSDTGERYSAGRAIPITRRVVFGAVAATCGGDDAAVEDWLEVSTFGAGWVGAAVLCFCMGASAEGADSGILAAGFDVAKSPAVIALFGGGRRVCSLNSIVATKDRDSGEIVQELTIFRGDLDHDRESLLVVEAGGTIRVEKAGSGNKNGLRVKYRGLQEVAQGSVLFRMGFDGKAVDREL